MATFVLIHGGCCSGADWVHVNQHLRSLGHEVLAPDLPGMGSDPLPLPEVTLELWGRFVADRILAQPGEVILVGHSRGGIVISQAAEYVPQKIRALVYVAAMLVPNGKTQGDVSSLVPRDISFLKLSDDGVAYTVDLDQVREIAFNRTPAAFAERAIAGFGREPAGCFAWSVQISGDRYGRVPRVYIETLPDNAIPLKLQRIMQASLPCSRVITMDSDHSPSHCAPRELADHLDSIAATDFGSPQQPGAV